jgi:hypothetical protein
MWVAVDTAHGVRFGQPTPLFQTFLTASHQMEEYAVHPDGRFLLTMPADITAPFTVITDWRSFLP